MAAKKKAGVTRVAVAALVAALTTLDELAKSVKLKANKGEKAEDYATRVCEEVAKLSDDDFGKLSPASQDWFNAAAEAINKGTAIPPPVSLNGKTEEKAATQETSQPQQQEATVATSKAKGKKNGNGKATKATGAEKLKKAKGTNGTAEKKASGPRTDSLAYKMRSVVVNKPDIAFDDAAKKVGVKAEVGGHAWNMFNHAKAVMEIVAAKG